MKFLYKSPKPHDVYVRRSFLESRGIECFVNNDKIYNNIDFLSPQLWLELFVKEDEDFTMANQYLGNFQSEDSTSLEDWRCRICGELVDGNLSICWNCPS